MGFPYERHKPVPSYPSPEGGVMAGLDSVVHDQRYQDRHQTPRLVPGAGFRVQGTVCRVQGSGCRVQGSRCRVQGAGCRVQGAGCRFRVQGAFSFGVAVCQWAQQVTSPSSEPGRKPLAVQAKPTPDQTPGTRHQTRHGNTHQRERWGLRVEGRGLKVEE